MPEIKTWFTFAVRLIRKKRHKFIDLLGKDLGDNFFLKYFQKNLPDKKEVVLLHPLWETSDTKKNDTFIDILDWQHDLGSNI